MSGRCIEMADIIAAFVIIGVALWAAGLWMGSAYSWNRVMKIYDDNEDGDMVRSSLGLHTEFSTPIPGVEEMRVVSQWKISQ
jgi:hypothetical protein